MDASIYYNKIAEVSVYEQAFVFPTAVTAIATTSTKFGIATKDLIGALRVYRSSEIQAVS